MANVEIIERFEDRLAARVSKPLGNDETSASVTPDSPQAAEREG